MLLNLVLLCFIFFYFKKVKLMVNPFAYEEYRKDKIRQKIEETRAQRVQLKVNTRVSIEATRERLCIYEKSREFSRETPSLGSDLNMVSLL